MTFNIVKRQIAAAVLAILLVGTVGSARAAGNQQSAPPLSPAATQTVAEGKEAPGVALDEGAGYAQREAQSPQMAAFKGGSVGVYVGGSTLAVVLLVVLLVILI